MDNFAIKPIGQQGHLLPVAKTELLLRTGEVIQGVVQEIVSADTVMLRVGNTLLEARTNLALDAGQILFLQVDVQGNEVRLRMTNNLESEAMLQNSLLSALRSLTNLGSPVAEIEQLASFLNEIPEAFKEQIPELSSLDKLLLRVEAFRGETLKSAVTSSGLFFETKLRLYIEQADLVDSTAVHNLNIPSYDLKGIILKIQPLLDDPNVVKNLRDIGLRPEQLERTLDRLLANIEYQQIQSRLSGTMQFFLPIIWNSLQEELFTFKKGHPDLSEKSYSCTINLAFKDFGKLRSHIIFHSNRIHVTMVSDNERFTHVLTAQAECLAKQLNDAGLSVGRLSVHFKTDVDFSEDMNEGLHLTV